MQFELTTDDSTADTTEAVAPGTSCCPAYPYDLSPTYCPVPEY